MTDTVDRIVIQAEALGVKLTTDQVDALRVAMDTTGQSGTTLENKFGSLERRLGTTTASAKEFAKGFDTINKAVAQNPALQERAAQAADELNKRFLAATAAEKELGNAHAGLSGQAQALQHAFRSTIDSLASGAPVTQVLGQEMGRLSYVMSGQGGVSGAFKELSGVFGGILTPMNLAIGGTVALTAAAAALALQYDKLQVSSQRAIGGAGARTGTTVTDLNKFADQNSSSTFGLTNKEAMALGQDLTKTGDIVISQLHGMSDAVIGFANQTEKSMADARKDFVAFAVDPKKGLEELSKAFGDVDPSVRKAVETLVVAGDKTGAFNVVLDAFAKKSKDAAQNMEVLDKASRGLVNSLGLAKPLATPSGLEKEIETAKAKLNAAIEGAASGGPSALAAAYIGKLTDQLVVLQQAADKVNGQKLADELNHIATEAKNDVDAILPQINALDALQKKINEINEAKTKGVAPANADGALAVLQRQKDLTQESLDTTIRQAQAVNQLKEYYGGVSTQTAMTLQNLQLQLQVAQALTGAEQMQLQAEVMYQQLKDQGVKASEAEAIADKQLEVSKANATTQVLKQVDALKDSTKMIKAQQDGTEATTAASIAYSNAIKTGADYTAAAALKAATLANYMAKAAQAASQYGNSLQTIKQYGDTNFGLGGLSPDQANGVQGQAAPGTPSEAFSTIGGSFGGGGGGGVSTSNIGYQLSAIKLFADQAASNYAKTTVSSILNSVLNGGGSLDSALQAIKGLSDNSTQKDFMGPNQFGIHSYATGGITQSDIMSTVQQLYQLKNDQAGDNATKVANDEQFMAWLQTQPQTLATQQAIAQLKQSIDGLANSTDSLNSTNQELLSPYYTQDPRTSHIGFRSQGMADGGYVDVPGAPSANDNMMAMIPVASGERIYVDPMPSKRGGSGGGQVINLSMNITIAGNANRDDVGRTMYQVGQGIAKQLAAASR